MNKVLPPLQQLIYLTLLLNTVKIKQTKAYLKKSIKVRYLYGKNEIKRLKAPASYYDVQVSRWMSADPIYDGLKNGLSIYGFCRNNPLNYHDPTGLETVKLLDQPSPTAVPKNGYNYDNPYTNKKKNIDNNNTNNNANNRPNIKAYLFRNKNSYKSLKNKENPKTKWSTNNTCLDMIIFVNETTNETVYYDKVQSVANNPDYNSNNTIGSKSKKKSDFNLLYNERTSTKFTPNDVMTIVDTMTIGSNANNTHYVDASWLLHSSRGAGQSTDWTPPGSGGCIMPAYDDTVDIFSTLRSWGIQNGQIIPGIIINTPDKFMDIIESKGGE